MHLIHILQLEGDRNKRENLLNNNLLRKKERIMMELQEMTMEDIKTRLDMNRAELESINTRIADNNGRFKGIFTKIQCMERFFCFLKFCF